MFLDIARELLVERGYHGLTMDRIADATEYSKGTIYQHFRCKEEVIVALAKRNLARRMAAIERSASFRGRPRERMVAIGEAMQIQALLYPADARVIQIINAEAITQKVTEKSLYEMRMYAIRGANIMVGIVRDALAQGDLVLDEATRPEELTFTLWALIDGISALTSWLPANEIGVTNPFSTVLRSCDALGDGYGWQPLSTEWDYNATRERVRDELFAEEARKAYGA
ncbi:MAG: helix-turn-helix transcriptional regulator [bacterium]|nr:helix-turn-helix transcriptional regulator [bacterium]